MEMKKSIKWKYCLIVLFASFIYITCYFLVLNQSKICFVKPKLINNRNFETGNTWYAVPNKSDGLKYNICSSIWTKKGHFKSEGEPQKKNNATNTLRTISEIVPQRGETCDTFLQTRGYWTKEVTQEETLFPISFSILVYKDLDQVERLLRAIYRPNNVYCIHADVSSSEMFRHSLKEIVRCFPNVFLCSKSEDVKWGMFSVVQAELNCWKELLESKVEWKYLINLTGFEYPLKTNAELVKILKAFNGTNNIDNENERQIGPWKIYLWGVPYILKTKLKQYPPHNIKVTKGSTHLAASRGYVEYALNDQKAKDWFQWCIDTVFPDEHCFSALNYNPHLKVPGSFIGSNLKKPKDWWVMRFKKWGLHNPEYKCQGEYVRDVCNIGLGDLYYVTRSKYLFLNKIDLPNQPLAYQCLEYWIRDRANDTISFDVSQYSKISSKRSFD